MIDDAIWKRAEPQSPCVRICVIHPDAGLCTGCLRTLDEIAGWAQMTPADRAEIMAQLPARAPRIAKRRGGRAARLKRET
ncbi:DUF1289 domain-containing protein [Actibacterium sp. D379-3]